MSFLFGETKTVAGRLHNAIDKKHISYNKEQEKLPQTPEECVELCKGLIDEHVEKIISKISETDSYREKPVDYFLNSSVNINGYDSFYVRVNFLKMAAFIKTIDSNLKRHVKELTDDLLTVDVINYTKCKLLRIDLSLKEPMVFN